MSSEAKYTERDMVTRERAAFYAGAECQEIRHRESRHWCHSVGLSFAWTEAQRRYEMPKIELPRVAQDPHYHTAYWRYASNLLQWRDDHDGWTTKPAWDITPARVKLWASLLAAPTELVDADGSVSSGTA